nr:SIP domain-containing protein [Rhizobium lusitanum]
MPAIARIAAAMPADAELRIVLEVADRLEEQPVISQAFTNVTWPHRDGGVGRDNRRVGTQHPQCRTGLRCRNLCLGRLRTDRGPRHPVLHERRESQRASKLHNNNVGGRYFLFRLSPLLLPRTASNVPIPQALRLPIMPMDLRLLGLS